MKDGRAAGRNRMGEISMSRKDPINIIMCGVGGQGTILASRLIAAAAMKEGLEVHAAETIGMAQRGGSVFTHIRLGEQAHAAQIGKGRADLLIGFEPAEAVRMLGFLKKEGKAIVSMQPIRPVSAMLGMSPYPEEEILSFLKEKVSGLTLVDSVRAAKDLGSSRCLNVVLLGAALRSGALGLDEEHILCALQERLPEKLHALNERALHYI